MEYWYDQKKKKLQPMHFDSLLTQELALDTKFDSHTELFTTIRTIYGDMTLSRGTVLFIATPYFQADIEEFEPCGTKMKLQDILTHATSCVQNKSIALPRSEHRPVLHASLSMEGAIEANMKNLITSIAVYRLDEDVNFLHLPFDTFYQSYGNTGYLKDDFSITEPAYWQNVVSSDKGASLAGMYSARPNGKDEIILVDHFSSFTKIAHVDLLDSSLWKNKKDEISRRTFVTNLYRSFLQDGNPILDTTNAMIAVQSFFLFGIHPLQIYEKYSNGTPQGSLKNTLYLESLPEMCYKVNFFA